MRRWIWIGAGLAVFIGLGFYMHQTKRTTIPAVEPVAEPVPGASPDPTMEQALNPRDVPAAPDRLPTDPADPGSSARPVQIAPVQERGDVVLTRTPATEDPLPFAQTIDSLVSARSGFEEKQAVWKLQTLIQQQETQPAQAHFARSYLRLGDQYLKAGQTDDAVQVWERGAAFFPNNEELKGKLAPAPSKP